MSKSGALDLASGFGGKFEKHQVLSAVHKYVKYQGGDEEDIKANYVDMVNKYYDLVTSFYEYGWGESFHFCTKMEGRVPKREHQAARAFSCSATGSKART